MKDIQRQQVLDALDVNLAARPLALLYQAALLAVALCMICLPLIYLSIIAVVAYGGFFWLTHMHTIFEHARGRGAILAAIVYLGPVVACAILLLFMLKPLFANPPERPQEREISRDEEPYLFRVVERICQVVGCRPPHRILISSNINASASFERGLLGVLTGQLVLTIGSPLIAGLTLRSLVGVLGHELGHFSQAAGMRLSFVIRNINAWFHRVAYERDSWDIWLKNASENWDLRIGIVLYVARGLVWLTRQLLRLLMMVGHGISCFLLRQMEYDADGYETELSGSECFKETLLRVTELNVLMQAAQVDIQNSIRDGGLPDCLPSLILAQSEAVSADVISRIQTTQLEEETKWWATHPSDKERIRAAAKASKPGLFSLGAPATILFEDFSRLSKELTSAFYLEHVGEAKLKTLKLLSTEECVVAQHQEQETFKAAGRFFQGQLYQLRLISATAGDGVAPESIEEAKDRLRQYRQRILKRAAKYARHYQRYDEADSKLILTQQGRILLAASYTLERGMFGLDDPSMTGSKRQLESIRSRMEKIALKLEPFETTASARLSLAIALLPTDQVRDQLEGVEQLEKEANELLALTELGPKLLQELLEVRNSLLALICLLKQLQAGEAPEAAVETMRRRARSLAKRMVMLRKMLGHNKYPFHVRGDTEVSLKKYVMKRSPDPEDIGSVINCADDLLNKLLPLHSRVVSRLAVIAEGVESALGLEPLPQFEDPDDEADMGRGAAG